MCACGVKESRRTAIRAAVTKNERRLDPTPTAGLLAMLLPLMSTGAAPVLRFADCKSGRPIVLVGCMHYNPVSVALAERVVRELAEEDQLGAVALEVCPSRWDSTLRAQPRGSLLRRICDNEFQAAAEVAEDFSCGLALADQSIEVTSGRLAQLAKQTVVQLFTGEAEAVRRDIGVGWRALQGEGVRAGAYVSPGLLLGAPVALLRYLAGSPIFAGALLALIAFTLGLEEISDPAAPAVEYAADLAFSGLETVVLLRVMLVGLIEERNFALARNIRAASMQVLTPPEAARERGAGKDGAAVVAVLGMAHLNGVRKLLTTSRAV